MENLKEQLQQLGLSGRESEVYLALLHKSELSAPEVAKVTTITRTKSYEILQNLVKKGMCSEKYRDGIKTFKSIEPNIALENLVLSYSRELNRVKDLAEQIKAELVNLHNENKEKTDPLDYIEVLSDVGQTRERWLKIQRNTKSELLGFTKPPYIVGSLGDNVPEESTILMNSKVKVKGIYEYEGLTTDVEIENMIKVLEKYQQLGEEVRIVKELPMKLVISDNNISMLALNDNITLKPSSITTMIITHPGLAIGLKNMFESYWSESITIEQFKKMNNKQ